MMLIAKNIVFQLGPKLILDTLNLGIEPGQIKSIVGPNGAGKSTLLKVLIGEHNNYKGQVSYKGKSLKDYSTKEISLLRAVLPQRTVVNFPFTVRQIVTLGRSIHKEKSVREAGIVDEILARMALEKFADRNYLTLSGGEKQKVQLARVLAQIWSNDNSPKLIILDEPTTSLDIAQQHYLLGMVKNISQKNIGVMAVIHDLNLAAQYSDEIIFLKQGQIIDQGPVNTVLTKYNVEKTFDHKVSVSHESTNGIPFVLPETSTFQRNHSNKINYYEQLIN